MVNIWVLAAVYDVCMHVLMEMVKPDIEGEYVRYVFIKNSGEFSLMYKIDGCLFSPYNRYVVVDTDPDVQDSVVVMIYSSGEFPLILYSEGDEYEEVYRALLH